MRKIPKNKTMHKASPSCLPAELALIPHSWNIPAGQTSRLFRSLRSSTTFCIISTESSGPFKPNWAISSLRCLVFHHVEINR